MREKFLMQTDIIQAIVKGFESADIDLPTSSHFHFAMCLDHCTIAQLDDMAAFIEWAENYDVAERSAVWVATQLAHDVQGIFAQERCFVPRTSGYARTLASHKKASEEVASG
jgi:hypothetical protein